MHEKNALICKKNEKKVKVVFYNRKLTPHNNWKLTPLTKTYKIISHLIDWNKQITFVFKRGAFGGQGQKPRLG